MFFSRKFRKKKQKKTVFFQICSFSKLIFFQNFKFEFSNFQITVTFENLKIWKFEFIIGFTPNVSYFVPYQFGDVTYTKTCPTYQIHAENRRLSRVFDFGPMKIVSVTLTTWVTETSGSNRQWSTRRPRCVHTEDLLKVWGPNSPWRPHARLPQPTLGT